MIAFRFIVVASTLITGSIVAADGLAAGRQPAPLADARIAAVSRPVRSGEGVPASRTCPERSWPYGAARCVARGSAAADGIRLIALDAGLPGALPRAAAPRVAQ